MVEDPLGADQDGVLALDARIRVNHTPSAGAERFAILPYPAQLAETVEWRGHRLLLRPIRPEDEARHRAFIERLAPDDLRLRFFFSRRELPRSEIGRLVQIDYAREMAFIALLEDAAGRPDTVGVVRALTDPDNVEAEFGISVRSDLKGQGFGRLLLDKMVRYLRDRGTQRLVGEVLHENRAMRELAHSIGMSESSDSQQGPVQHYVIELQTGGAGPVALPTA